MQNMEQVRNESERQVRKLLGSIQNTTIIMSNTFEQAILRHEQQFLKAYRIKISELIHLFQELTKILEDKFISNALTQRLEIVSKERDYFKYECLKLNVQYQNSMEDQKNLTQQLANTSEQIKIYRHLLQEEKLKNNELEKATTKIKENFNALAYNSLKENDIVNKPKTAERANERSSKKMLQQAKMELKRRGEQIRSLRTRVNELEMLMGQRQVNRQEKKEMYEIFRACVNGWKREILTKERHNAQRLKENWDAQKLSTSNKKELLKKLFTSSQFLQLIESLLFSPQIEVMFVRHQQKQQRYILQNRRKLFEFMRKKRILPYSR